MLLPYVMLLQRLRRFRLYLVRVWHHRRRCIFYTFHTPCPIRSRLRPQTWQKSNIVSVWGGLWGASFSIGERLIIGQYLRATCSLRCGLITQFLRRYQMFWRTPSALIIEVCRREEWRVSWRRGLLILSNMNLCAKIMLMSIIKVMLAQVK